MSDIYAEFDEMIYQEAWQYLEDYEQDKAIVLKRIVDKGGTPEELRRRWLRLAGEHRIELARRIENAATYLLHQRQRA